MIENPERGLADSILEQAADAVIFADVEGIIRIWNKAAEVIFGFTAGEAVDQSLDLIVPERLRTAHWTRSTARWRQARPGLAVAQPSPGRCPKAVNPYMST